MTIAPAIGLVVGDDARPFIVVVALVIVLLVLAVGVLMTRRRGVARPRVSEPEEADEKAGSNVRVIERRAKAQSQPEEPRRQGQTGALEPEEAVGIARADVGAVESSQWASPPAWETVPEAQIPPGEPWRRAQATGIEHAEEDDLRALAEPGGAGANGERDKLLDGPEELGATEESNSPSADGRSQVPEAVSNTAVNAEAKYEPAGQKTPGRTLVERLRERPAPAIAATLVGVLVLRSMIRRR